MKELTLETRRPAPLSNAGYHELARVFPAVAAAVYFVNADGASAAWVERLPSLAENGAEHWVPGDVFAGLNGEPIHGGGSKVYFEEANALADLRAVWGEVRNAA